VDAAICVAHVGIDGKQAHRVAEASADSRLADLAIHDKILGLPMSRIDLPEDVLRLAEAQINAGRAGSIEDVVRAGVEALELRDQEKYEAKLAALRTAIDDGDASGVFDGDPFATTRAKHDLHR
jgi:antitoxin ParD1/3/4